MAAELRSLFTDPLTGISRSVFLKSAKSRGISDKDALDFYNTQKTVQVHARHPNVFNSIVARPNSWAMDLTFYDDFAGLPANRKKIGVLIALEQTSRFVWARPIRNKSAKEIAKHLVELLSEHEVRTVVTDEGGEFKSEVAALFADHDIEHYASSRKGSTSKVERFNRTLRERLSKLFVANSSHAWVPYLQDIVTAYNTTPSRACLGHTPEETLSNSEINSLVRNNDRLRGEESYKNRGNFNTGDEVRITLEKSRFDKLTGPRWSSEIYTVESTPGKLLLRVRDSSGKLKRRGYAAWELKPYISDTSENSVANATQGTLVDIPQVRKNKRVKAQLDREGIRSENVLSNRRPQSRLPSRYQD